MDNFEIVEVIKKYAKYYITGAMSKELAELCAKQYIEKYNKIAREVAKKHGVSPKTVTFQTFLR